MPTPVVDHAAPMSIQLGRIRAVAKGTVSCRTDDPEGHIAGLI